MRKARIQQLPLAEATTDHPKAKALKKISEILDRNSSIYDLVLQDIGASSTKTGARGMTAEQVLRAALIKQMEGVQLSCSCLSPDGFPCVQLVLQDRDRQAVQEISTAARNQGYLERYLATDQSDPCQICR